MPSRDVRAAGGTGQGRAHDNGDFDERGEALRVVAGEAVGVQAVEVVAA
jgi:hypothetical protein